MSLNVVKYINYGWVLTGGDDKFYEDRFYWSFYELSNKNIIELQLFETVQNDITKFSEYTFNYPCYELKNDLQIKYKFGQDFYKWFDSIPPFNSVKPYKYPNKIEKKCVMNFYENNVVKENKTNIIIT
jgi:hypothetical protein